MGSERRATFHLIDGTKVTVNHTGDDPPEMPGSASALKDVNGHDWFVVNAHIVAIEAFDHQDPFIA